MSARKIGLVQLIGYLMAGFVRFHFGMEASETLDNLVAIGATMCTNGLKLNFHALLHPEV